MFKKGDRVEWNFGGEKSTGTVIRMGTSRNAEDQNHVYVEWDDVGEAYVSIKHTKLLYRAEQGLTEESAVMFLLNLGYTVAKK